MTENYGKSVLRKVTFFYGTDEQANTSNWSYVEAILPGGSDINPNLVRDWSRFGRTLSFRPAGQATDEIIFSRVDSNGVMPFDFCGTLNGPRSEDVNWKQCGANPYNLGHLGQAAFVKFARWQNGKPVVRIKYGCDPNGACSHVDFEFEFD